MFNSLLKLVFPPRCIFCRTIVDNTEFSVCTECELEIKMNDKKKCKKCSTPLTYTYGDMLCQGCRKTKRYFKRAYSPLIYEKDVRRSIINFKFHGKSVYARTLAVYMYHTAKLENIKADAITYVPLHFIRRGLRGYNQSQLLAEHLGKMMDIPVISFLRKKKYTKALSRTKHKQRKNIVKDTFEITKPVQEMELLLVDDIITTGSTINECAKVLLKGGASGVEGIAAAVTPHEI